MVTTWITQRVIAKYLFHAQIKVRNIHTNYAKNDLPWEMGLTHGHGTGISPFGKLSARDKIRMTVVSDVRVKSRI